MEYRAPAQKDILKTILISAVNVILDASHAVFQINHVKRAKMLTSEFKLETFVHVNKGTLI